MGLFNKKQQKNTVTEFRCPVEGCSFTNNDSSMLKRHVDWKHPKSINTGEEDSNILHQQKVKRI